MRLIKFIKTNDLIKQYIIRIILKKLILNLFLKYKYFYIIFKMHLSKIYMKI